VFYCVTIGLQLIRYEGNRNAVVIICEIADFFRKFREKLRCDPFPSPEIHIRDNEAGVDRTLQAMENYHGQKGLIFVNLVNFDMVYGHRRDVAGYAGALEAFDRRIPQVLQAMSVDDLLMITADHGCDPGYTVHTDHTREYVPLLVYGKEIRKGVNLGVRQTFADCGQTIADILDAGKLAHGVSFKKNIIYERI